MLLTEEQYLAHYGMPRRSGRYPWGSGDSPYQGSGSFLGHIRELKKQGLTDAQIAQGLGIRTRELRAYRSIAVNEKRHSDILQAQRLKDKGWSNTAIGERMGINESSVRGLLAPGAKDKSDILTSTANMLKDQVAQKEYLDVGQSVERHIGISRDKLDTAIAMLEAEGYSLHTVNIQQVGTGKMTKMTILAPADHSQRDVFMNRDKIQQIENFSEDNGRSYLNLHDPLNVDSSRIQVKYGSEGGAEADGVMYIRPGVEDVSLGEAGYAQVRVGVDGTHYLKGMAIYKSDLPDGVDIQFNTNKEFTGDIHDAMKKQTGDPDNPFGASIKRQIIDVDAQGNETVTSAMNIVNEEGDWDSWSRNMSTQMLSKQSVPLAEAQLNKSYEARVQEFNEINSMTNPEVKRQLMGEFADSVDSSAVNLEAAALPRQASQVILPVNSLKDTEVYAPNFRDGERVALVRYPHGGTFEIPELTVNNRNPEGRDVIGTNSRDAIGINANVAERLSGADFDGDTVVVFPNNSGKIKSSPALEGLKGFDPQSYKYPEGAEFTKMTDKQKGMEMGQVSNLITDMSIAGANEDELARGVRHSMVVIDAQKHDLNYKQSALDNGIPQLKEKYQGGKNAGASTLISRATASVHVDERQLRKAQDGGPINKETGEKVYTPTGRTYEIDGRTIPAKQKSTRLAETKDARTLVSDAGSPMEDVYATHSNRLKALANDARKVEANTQPASYSPSAKKVYAKEVSSLDAKLNVAKKNEPRERQAQVIANSVYSQKVKANPDMSKDDKKKVKGQALAAARNRTGADKTRVEITDREWDAIQSGAVSTHKQREVLRYADGDRVRELAMPKKQRGMSSSQAARAQAMLNSGYTQAEVADALGVSTSTLNKELN